MAPATGWFWVDAPGTVLAARPLGLLGNNTSHRFGTEWTKRSDTDAMTFEIAADSPVKIRVLGAMPETECTVLALPGEAVLVSAVRPATAPGRVVIDQALAAGSYGVVIATPNVPGARAIVILIEIGTAVPPVEIVCPADPALATAALPQHSRLRLTPFPEHILPWQPTAWPGHGNPAPAHMHVRSSPDDPADFDVFYGAPVEIETATPLAEEIGQKFNTWAATRLPPVVFGPATAVAVATGPDAVPAFQVDFLPSMPLNSLDTILVLNSITENLLLEGADVRQFVSLRWKVWFEPADWLALTDTAGGSETWAFLKLFGLAGGQAWPGVNGNAYPTGTDPAEGDNWTVRAALLKSGNFGVMVNGQNNPVVGRPWTTKQGGPLIGDLMGRQIDFELACQLNQPGMNNGVVVLVVDGETTVYLDTVRFRDAAFGAAIWNAARYQMAVTGITAALEPSAILADRRLWFRDIEFIAMVGPGINQTETLGFAATDGRPTPCHPTAQVDVTVFPDGTTPVEGAGDPFSDLTFYDDDGYGWDE